MSLSVGIVGLPNVGKSTLFNALLKRQAALAANYPFATIEPNVGIVDVPDIRLEKLVEVVKNEYSSKFKDREIIFVDSLSLPAINTRAAVEIINNLSAVLGRGKILAALYARNEKAEKSFRNLPRVEVSFVKNLNPVQALNHKYLLVENPEESVKFLASRGN